VACCFALLFLFPRLFPNLNYKRYRHIYLATYFLFLIASCFLAVYSPSVQSLFTHLLSALVLLILILASSLLPVMMCYDKYALSWRDLLIGLRLVITTSERIFIYILEKWAFWFIFLIPLSIISSYLLAEARIINIPFSTLVPLLLFSATTIAVAVEIWRKFSKSLSLILALLLFVFTFNVILYTLYNLLTLAGSHRELLEELLEFSPKTFYAAIAMQFLLIFFSIMLILESPKCREKWK